jgi:hypothetical protein
MLAVVVVNLNKEAFISHVRRVIAVSRLSVLCSEQSELSGLCQQCLCFFTTDMKFSTRFFGGGGQAEEEETIAKGDDVIIELDASLEDLYMGGSLKVISFLEI